MIVCEVFLDVCWYVVEVLMLVFRFLLDCVMFSCVWVLMRCCVVVLMFGFFVSVCCCSVLSVVFWKMVY